MLLQACNTDSCPAYIFRTSAWSVCTKTCGGGTSSRNVYCEDLGTSTLVSDDACLLQGVAESSVKPDESRSCNTLPCLGEGGVSWVVDSINPCGQDGELCGGTATRSITCRCGTVLLLSNHPSTTNVLHHCTWKKLARGPFAIHCTSLNIKHSLVYMPCWVHASGVYQNN